MAAPSDISVRGEDRGAVSAEIDTLRAQLNNVVASLRLLTAKLDLDAGVTDTTYNSLITDGAITTAPCKVNRMIG